MPVYQITAPDGRKLRITAPDGATQEQALAYAQQQLGQQPADSKQQKYERLRAEFEARQPSDPMHPSNNPTTGMSTFDKIAAGAGKSVADTWQGLEQIYAGIADKVAPRQRTTADLITGRDPSRYAEVTREVDARRRLDAPLMNTSAGMLGNIGGQALQIAVPVPGAASVKLAQVAGKAAPFIGAGLRGAAYSGLQGTTEGESRAQNAAIGGGLGVFGQGVAAGAGRLGAGLSDKLSPAIKETYNAARAAGIPVHYSQISQSKPVKTLASVAGYLPFSGTGAAKAAQEESFMRALSRTFGKESPVLTDEVMAQAKNAISRQYQDIFSRKSVQLDDQALSELGRLEQTLARRLPQDQAAMVKANIDNVLANTDNGVMPGEVYQALRGELSGTGASGRVMRELRGILDNTAFRSVGARDAEALKAANRQWANATLVEKALKQARGAQGEVNPANLWGIIRGGSTKEMRELGRIGQLISNKIPDSGTQGRQMTAGFLAGGGAPFGGPLGSLGVIGAGAIGGRVLNSPLFTNYLVQGANPVLQGTARTLTRPAPLLLPAVANAKN